MKIIINQTLHGYQHGHQLLATSVDLTIDAKKTLLFQSDLSGSNILKGFETYISGYPIPNSKYYALAKTWYAGEMPRPGCVWTHTFLIEIVDVGKIPEFASVSSNFARPKINEYEFYQNPIEIEFDNLFNEGLDEKILYDKITSLLYTNPSKIILIKAQDNSRFEGPVLNIWSDQWPRLRRTFSFCTGALAIKQINGKEFDLQVVPSKHINSKISEQDKFLTIDEKEAVEIPDWIEILHSKPKSIIRKFLWLYGADIIGARVNYPILVQLFNKISLGGTSLGDLTNIIRENMPLAEEGKSFKQFLFNGSSGKFPENDVLAFLITEKDLEFLQFENLDVPERIIRQVNNGNIGFSEFISIWKLSQPNRISYDIWEKLDIAKEDIVDILENNYDLIDVILSKRLHYCDDPEIWKASIYTQSKIFRVIQETYPNHFPDHFLIHILDVQSPIVIEVLKYYNEQVVFYSLSWSLLPGNCLLTDFLKKILFDYKEAFFNWFRVNKSCLNAKVILYIFSYYDAQTLFSLPIIIDDWILIYNTVKKEDYGQLPYVSAIILALGFRNQFMNSELLVVIAFEDVFKFASESALNGIWDLIPKDLDGFEDEGELTLFDNFIKLFGINPSKKRYQIPYWDHCELLIITYTHRFIKNRWSQQYYLDGLKATQPFKRAIAYCITFKKGREYLNTLKKNLLQKNLHGTSFQIEVLDQFEL